MSHSFHVILGRQAERHRTHAHAFDIVKMHAPNSGAKFFELLLDVPLFHPGNVRRPDCGIARSVCVVTGDASLEKFLAPSGGIRSAQAASGESESADQEQHRPKRDSMGNGFLSFAHAQSQMSY
jgi:hypothetical protein